MFINMGLGCQTEWISIPALPLSECVTFSSLLNVSLFVMVITIRYYVLSSYNSNQTE